VCAPGAADEGLLAACTRSRLSDQRTAERRLTVALNRALDATQQCETEADDVATAVADVKTAESEAVRQNDAAIAGQRSGKTPAVAVLDEALKEIDASVQRARTTAAAIDRGCP
jgi:hypothetical protein